MPKIYKPDIKDTDIKFIKTPLHSIRLYHSTGDNLKANNIVGVITQSKDVNDTKTSTTTGDGILNLRDVHPIGNNKSINPRRKKENEDTFIRMKF